VVFPCKVNRTKNYYRPDTAHELAPGDVAAVAAMGDFVAAATGATATALDESGTDFRGASFATGGDGGGDWRQTFSLATILKEFNPNLIGLSKGTFL